MITRKLWYTAQSKLVYYVINADCTARLMNFVVPATRQKKDEFS